MRKHHTVFHNGTRVYIPMNRAWGFHFLHMLVNTSFLFAVFLIIVILTSARWYLSVVLICISLLICDFEHLFLYVGHLHVFFGKIPIQILCPFFNQVIFLILSYMCSLCILVINPLPGISFANIFSHSLCRLPFCFIGDFLHCAKAV